MTNYHFTVTASKAISIYKAHGLTAQDLHNDLGVTGEYWVDAIRKALGY
jgi:hypothetical protein